MMKTKEIVDAEGVLNNSKTKDVMSWMPDGVFKTPWKYSNKVEWTPKYEIMSEMKIKRWI